MSAPQIGGSTSFLLLQGQTIAQIVLQTSASKSCKTPEAFFAKKPCSSGRHQPLCWQDNTARPEKVTNV
jgi:hypothetical protein